jgi:hypothetical protein
MRKIDDFHGFPVGLTGGGEAAFRLSDDAPALL